MKASPESAQELVEMLDAQGVSQNRLFTRLLDHLRELTEEREALERLAQYETTIRSARTAAIVEARALLPRLDPVNTTPCLLPMH